MYAFSRKFLFASALTLIPLFTEAAPLCAVQPASAELSSTVPPNTTVSYPASNESVGLTSIPAAKADQIPALQRIQASGAQLYELGEVHGLHSVFAVAGESFQVFYLSPDGQMAIRGIAQDASGKNLTRDQVAQVPGAIPTVVLSGEPRSSSAASQGAGPAALHVSATSPLQTVQATTYGTEGHDDAPRLWMFADPQCSFSRRAMQQLQPYVISGRVQVAVIPVSLLDHEDQGLSTARAEVMLSLPREQMVEAWAGNQLAGPAEAGAIATLQANMMAADRIGLVGTPTFIWRKADGSEGRADGIPTDLEAMIAPASR